MRDSTLHTRVDGGAARALLVPGSVAMLTTRGRQVALRTRPVTLQASPTPGMLTVLTSRASSKVAEVRAQPAIGLSGPTTDGWFSVDASATITSDPRVLQVAARSAGLTMLTGGYVALLIKPLRGRRWFTGAGYGWDNRTVNVHRDDVFGLEPASPVELGGSHW